MGKKQANLTQNSGLLRANALAMTAKKVIFLEGNNKKCSPKA